MRNLHREVYYMAFCYENYISTEYTMNTVVTPRPPFNTTFRWFVMYLITVNQWIPKMIVFSHRDLVGALPWMSDHLVADFPVRYLPPRLPPPPAIPVEFFTFISFTAAFAVRRVLHNIQQERWVKKGFRYVQRHAKCPELR